MQCYLLAVMSTLGALFFKASGGADENVMYGPTDTRIVTVSNTLCDKMQLMVGESDLGYKVYLYALHEPPTVTEHSSFHLLNKHPVFQCAGNYQYYSYYMLKGSTFNVSACVLDQKQPKFNFYVIKGNKNFLSAPVWQGSCRIPRHGQLALSNK